MNHRQTNKAEQRLYEEIIKHCIEGNPNPLKTQFRVNLTTPMYGKRSCILDIAIPQLMIAIRVMGGVHGEPWAINAKDETQGELLKRFGWDVIDVWHTERPDLWI